MNELYVNDVILAKYIKHVRIKYLIIFIGFMVIYFKEKKDYVCLIVLSVNYLFIKLMEMI